MFDTIKIAAGVAIGIVIGWLTIQAIDAERAKAAIDELGTQLATMPLPKPPRQQESPIIYVPSPAQSEPQRTEPYVMPRAQGCNTNDNPNCFIRKTAP